MKAQMAEALLRDLARWTFGGLLADRAAFHAMEPEVLAAEVRAFRYGILLAILKEEQLKERSLAEIIVAAPWELMLEWSAVAEGLEWGPSAEEALALHFIMRMQKFGEVTEALRRFARGKAFKYGRRVLLLSKKQAP